MSLTLLRLQEVRIGFLSAGTGLKLKQRNLSLILKTSLGGMTKASFNTRPSKGILLGEVLQNSNFCFNECLKNLANIGGTRWGLLKMKVCLLDH